LHPSDAAQRSGKHHRTPIAPRRHVIAVRRLVAAVGAAGLMAACSASASGSSARLAINGLVLAATDRSVTPGLAGTTLAGAHFDVNEWRGNIVVVNFWGSWCAPCRQEAPNLQRAASETYSRGVRFVGIDVRDSRDSAIGFENSYHVIYPSLFDQASRQGLEFHRLAPQATPSTFVLDRQGRVAARFIGATSYRPLMATIDQLLAQS
jgi:thiol-disulfide isomerase/thioredoxin